MARAKAETASEAAPVKRPKTGGRPPKKDLSQMLEETRVRSELAAMHDDTTLPAELAAIYLCISVKQLGELRKRLPERSSKGSKNAAGEPPKKGLKMIKLSDKEAIGTNQPVTYKLGDLRAYQESHSGYDTFETSLASGILGWVTERCPFFALPGKSKNDPQLVRPAWDFGVDVAAKEEFIGKALNGTLQCLWMPPAAAASSVWTSKSAHDKFALRWLKLLHSAEGDCKRALEGTAINDALLNS